MKTKRAIRPQFFLMVCALLCAALLVSIVFLARAKAEVQELEAEILNLTEENQQLSLLNQALQTQLMDETGISPDGEFYCELSIDDWSQSNGSLTINAFAQAFLPSDAQPTAQIELWRGSAVIASVPITLNATEISGAFETEATLSFKIPAIEADEELEIWLIVEAPGCNSLFTCGAGWYLDGNQLMIIAG